MTRLIPFSRLLSLFLFFAFFASSAQSATPEYKKQALVYNQLCSSINRPNIDCQCVAKAHATYAHLSPNQRYADYLIERYKDRIGQANQQDEALKRYADGRTSNEIQIEIMNAFGDYESADPFREEVRGCVIPNAPKVLLAALPKAPIFKEVYDYRVSSSGTERLEQCKLVELERVLTAQELTALHYVFYRGIDGNTLANKLNMTEEQAKTLAIKADKKLKEHQKNTLNIGNYCDALLAAEENSSGNIKSNYARTNAERAGTPLGLEGVNTNIERPPLIDNFGNKMASMQAEAKKIQAENANQPSVKERIQANQDLQKAKALKNTQAANATSPLLTKGCIGAGRTDAFCSCFVDNFMNDIGESGGAAALPIIQDGISDSETMALMKSIDQRSYMQNMSKALVISTKCEQVESSEAASQLSSITGSAEERYKAVCTFNDNASAEFCGCAAKHLASKITEQELNMLANLEISQRQDEGADITSLAADLGMTEMQLMQQMASNPKLLSASMGVVGACM